MLLTLVLTSLARSFVTLVVTLSLHFENAGRSEPRPALKAPGQHSSLFADPHGLAIVVVIKAAGTLDPKPLASGDIPLNPLSSGG
jgi:hypothetical protein